MTSSDPTGDWPAQLAQLSLSCREELQQAACLADNDLIDQWAAALPAEQTELAAVTRALAADFSYEQILAWCSECATDISDRRL